MAEKTLSVILAAMGLLAAAPSLAAPSDAWFLGIVSADQTREYIEESSIDPLPDRTRIAWLTNITPGRGADHRGFTMLRSQVRFDCAKHTYEYLEGVTYDLHGAVLQTAKPATSDWDATSIEGGTAVAEAFVCNDKSYWVAHFRRVQPGDAFLRPDVPPSKGTDAPPTQ